VLYDKDKAGMTQVSNKPPAISVIMPIYNIEAYVGDAIRSVLAQTIPDFELILIDDGSTDMSASVAEEICKDDLRVRILRQSNQGLSATRNRGIEFAVGNFIYFMDGDDLLAPDALAVCLEWACRYQLDFVAFSGEVFFDSPDVVGNSFGNYHKPDLLKVQRGEKLLVTLEALAAYSSSPCLYICSRSLIEKFNLRFDEGYVHEDEGFTPELYCCAERAISLKARLFRRRVRPGSIMATTRSFTNVSGCVQAALRLDQFLARQTMLRRVTRATLRRRQRAVLRMARKEAERIDMQRYFSTLLCQHISIVNVFAIDPMMLVYVRANRMYKYLRAASHYLKSV
jgi:glycosyltransferase involved in cell wall biosynthesis